MFACCKMATRVFNSFKILFLSLLVNLSLSGLLKSEDILVEDSLFTADEIRGMKTLLSHEETVWNFKQSRESIIDQADMDTQGKTSPANSCYSWSTNLTPVSFIDSSAWKKLTKTLSSNFGCDCRILAFEGQINFKGSQLCSKRLSVNDGDFNSYIAVIFLVENWKRNSYGELIVYNHDNGEILKAVHPKPGRLVIFPAFLEHVIKPPANDMSGRLYVMKFHLSVSSEKQQINASSRKSINTFEQLPSFNLLTKADVAPMEKVDIKQFITRNFTTVDGRSIVVLDDVFPNKELDALRHTITSSGYNDNAAGMDSTDNVQWIMAFEVEEFVQTSMWQLISQIVITVSGKEGYYPYDIGCNNIQSADTTTIHKDCAPGENEFTLLIYLNQNWTLDNHGETVFFNDEESELIFAVRPRYGRVAIFHGTIPHSARPPPLIFTGARLSFAVKMSPSKEIANKKSFSMETGIFYEALETLQGVEAEKVKKILQDINDGKVDRQTLEKLVQEYEAKLH